MTPAQSGCPSCGYITGHAEECSLVALAKTVETAKPYISPGPLDMAAPLEMPKEEDEMIWTPPQPINIPDGSIKPQVTPLIETLQKRQGEITAARRAAVEQALAEADADVIFPVKDEGRKDDDGKIRHELVPTDVMDEVARVLTFGANKYGDRNWERGMKWGRVIGAAIRHIYAVMRGEDRDPETGLLHSAHAICCMMFLCGYQIRKIGTDDRKPL